MRILEHRRISAKKIVSRQSSLNIHPANSRRRTTVSAKSVSSRMSSIHEDRHPDLAMSWTSVLSDPDRKCSSPPPALECDGFHCDDYSVEAARVASHHISYITHNISHIPCSSLWERAKTAKMPGKTSMGSP
jgi:hypothetical protein